MNIQTNFTNDLNNLNIPLTNYQHKQFELFFELLLSENKKFNLTAITKADEVYKKHFIDSLSLVKYSKLSQPYKLIDIGTGAGFPGIPLKIAFPEIKLTLIDSQNKRINFLNNLITILELTNIEAIHARAEELAHNPSFREQFDIAVSRAVANLSTLSEYCLPFVRPGGLFISYKSENITSELSNTQKSISLLGGQIDRQISFNLPMTDIPRTLIGVKKINKTPVKYPRNPGIPTKRPL